MASVTHEIKGWKTDMIIRIIKHPVTATAAAKCHVCRSHE